MSIAPSIAASAYDAVQKGSKEAGGAAAAAAASAGAPDFGAMVRGAMESAVETGRTAETAAIGAAAGETQLVDVVTSIAAAEVTLQTAVTVRDRVVEAYQEIMRMPI
jgi:flagellar hook-basal body complex protein FliE